MLNYEEIEKIYYKRRRRKFLIIFASIFAFIGGVFFAFNYFKKENNTKSSNIKKIIPQKISNNHNTNMTQKLTINSEIPNIDLNPKTESKNNKITIKTTSKTPKNKIKVVVVQKSQKLQDLLNYYKSFKDYDTAIKIAQIYFKQKNYRKSIEWAKKANDINAKDEKSWLLYAKNLVQLGKIIKAKTLLKLYLEIYGPNKNIQNYLRSIK